MTPFAINFITSADDAALQGLRGEMAAYQTQLEAVINLQRQGGSTAAEFAASVRQLEGEMRNVQGAMDFIQGGADSGGGMGMHGARRVGGVAAGVGVMAANAVEGANSTEGMSRAIRDLGSAAMIAGPEVGILTMGVGMFIEQLLKASAEAEKKKIAESFRANEAAAKSYIGELAKLDELDLKQHEESLKSISQHWKEIADNIKAAKAAEDEMRSAMEDARKPIREREMLNELAKAQPSEYAAIRQKFKDRAELDRAQNLADKAHSDVGEADSLVHAKEGEIGARQTSINAEGQRIIDARNNKSKAAKDLADLGLKSDQQRTIDDYNRVDKLTNDAVYMGLQSPEEQMNLYNQYERLQKLLPRVNKQLQDGRPTFETERVNQKEAAEGKTPNSNESSRLEGQNKLSAIEAYGEKSAAMDAQVAASTSAIANFATEIKKLTSELDAASNKLSAAHVKASAADVALANVPSAQIQHSIDSSNAAGDKSALESAKKALADEKAEMSNALGNMVKGLEGDLKSHPENEAKDAKAIGMIRDALRHLERERDNVGGVAHEIAGMVSSIATSIGAKDSSTIKAFGDMDKKIKDLADQYQHALDRVANTTGS